MQALVYDPDAPQGLRLGEAPEPRPAASQVLVEVRATSLNFGEVAFLRDRHNRGDVAGGQMLADVYRLLAAGQLDPQVGWRGSWDRASEAAELLLGRRVRGKAMLEVAG